MTDTEQHAQADLPRERTAFRTLLATNPNYFGTFEEADLPFEVVHPKTLDSTYEELTCVGYEPRRAELEATFAQKRAFGFNGGPCSSGSREYVRFYVDRGSGWTDAGMAGVRVTDLAPRDDCADRPIHPLHHTLTVHYAPRRRPCTRPQFVRVRAILSWNAEPPGGAPNHQPVWGSVMECTIQIAPARRLALTDLVDRPNLVKHLKLPEDLADLVEQEIPLPKPPVYSLQRLAEHYRRAEVEPHRWAMAPALAATAGEAVTAAQVESVVGEFKLVDLDLADILTQVEDTQGNVSYEELECLGLDDNRERLVATFRIKRSSGYSGPLCSDGSTEYVAFWVDWDDTCEWEYAGTAEVAAHDLEDLPDGGLCYSAVLPVDLEALRRDCDEPRVARIRAVLSWNTPPSTTDPDHVPVWGNRLDTHVRVLPGVTGNPDAPATWITLIGGINVTPNLFTSGISPITGTTTSNAVFADIGVLAGAGRPFGRWVVVRGPSLPGHQYRVEKKKASEAVWTPMTDSFQTTNDDGTLGSLVTPAADGTVSYLAKQFNFTNLLGRFRPGGDDLWEIRLVVLGVGTSPTYRVQLDNTSPDVDIDITAGAGTCGKFGIGTTLQGTFSVSDPHLSAWTLSVPDPDPSDPTNVVNAPNPHASVGANPPDVAPGTGWTLATTGMKSCGYNIVLWASDDSILNSSSGGGNRASTRAGFCLE